MSEVLQGTIRTLFKMTQFAKGQWKYNARIASTIGAFQGVQCNDNATGWRT